MSRIQVIVFIAATIAFALTTVAIAGLHHGPV
jgi:hypothetical protein